ncbi:MAG: tetratricopeptide repeat protein [Candidatus Aenigmarchaeota archaeon]|nr:tetratricopeptide repeat protein [Candidatus Aenigmarchaeota archaeon]
MNENDIKNILERFEKFGGEKNKREIKKQKTLILLSELAEFHFNEGDFKEALRYYNKIVKKSPTDIYSWCKLSNLLIKLGQFEKAEKKLKEAIKYNPDHGILYFNLARSLYLQGKIKEGDEAIYKSKTSLYPGKDNSENLVILYENIKEWQKCCEIEA